MCSIDYNLQPPILTRRDVRIRFHVSSGHSERVRVDLFFDVPSICACCAPRGRVAPLGAAATPLPRGQTEPTEAADRQRPRQKRPRKRRKPEKTKMQQTKKSIQFSFCGCFSLTQTNHCLLGPSASIILRTSPVKCVPNSVKCNTSPTSSPAHAWTNP